MPDYCVDLCGDDHDNCIQEDQAHEYVHTGGYDFDVEVIHIACSCPCHEEKEKHEANYCR